MEYTCFWKNSVFSNFHKVEYEFGDITFNCSEQGIIFEKIKLFDPTRDEIIRVFTLDDPMKITQLGQKVKNFKEEVWRENIFRLIQPHLIAKFKQNNDLKKALLDTKNTILVEASPYDKIWGVGMDEKEVLSSINSEKLQKRLKYGNFLGKLLMEAREIIRKQE